MLPRGRVLAFTLCLVLGLSGTAHAYIDPGTASFFFQFMLAALFGALFAIKSRWRQLLEWVQRKRSPPPPAPPEQ